MKDLILPILVALGIFYLLYELLYRRDTKPVKLDSTSIEQRDYLIPFVLISKQRYEEMKETIADQRDRLAMSGTDRYLNDAAIRTERYDEMARRAIEAEHTVDAQIEEIETLKAMVKDMREMLLKDDPSQKRYVTQPRDNRGRFKEAPLPKFDVDIDDDVDTDDADTEDAEYLDDPIDDGDYSEQAQDEEDLIDDALSRIKETKQIKAYRMSQNGASKEVIAQTVQIGKSSVRAYISQGRKELEEMRIPVKTDYGGFRVNGLGQRI